MFVVLKSKNVNKAGVLLLAFLTMSSGSYASTDISIPLTSLLERHALANGIDIMQLGTNNQLVVSQDGQTNYAFLLQQGEFNDISLSQHGLGNQSLIRQYGNNNSADILQHGHQNLIQLEQWGGRSFSIEQSGIGAAISITQF
ncbi:curlin subunit CsgB [Arsukibacterium sp.]|uniref:curlin subunit CsgB n=1 Tax=Arsukibacterium sp. TaxID=1977258 RepID=UPI002FD96353